MIRSAAASALARISAAASRADVRTRVVSSPRISSSIASSGLAGHAEAGLGPLGPLPQLVPLALEALDQGGDLVQEGPHLLLLVPSAAHREG